MAEIDGIELEDFLDHVDNVVEGLKDGSITKNPLHVEAEEVGEAVLATTAASGSATEYSEEEMAANSKEGVKINGVFFEFTEDGECNGNPTGACVVVSNEEGEVVFGNAGLAAREVGLNPTTVRTRCSKEYVDADGNTWKYRDKV